MILERMKQKFHRYKVYNDAKRLSIEVIRLTNTLKDKRMFAYSNQIEKSALSITSNIAEGVVLGTTPLMLRHIRIALGSASELYSQLEIVNEIGSIPHDLSEILNLNGEVIAQLFGLRRKLEQSS